MADLNTVAEWLKAFYRLVGSNTTDTAMQENGESADEVAYTCLNTGVQQAQSFMIGCGMTNRWRKRSTAITSWSGADSTDGGRYKDLSGIASDFLRFSGKPNDASRSSLTEANGARWGIEIDADFDILTGDVFYLKNEQLWIGQGASPPATIYIDYQFRHPEITSAVTLNFPSDAAGLVIAYAGRHAMAEGWFPRADGVEKIRENAEYWERLARQVARRTRQKRKQDAPRTIGTRFWAGR